MSLFLRDSRVESAYVLPVQNWPGLKKTPLYSTQLGSTCEDQSSEVPGHE